MERRFVRAWERIEARRDNGESFADVLRNGPTRELVGALAVAATRDPVAANAIATELLNRERRAPYLGAFLVSLTMFVTVYITDFVLTGTLLTLDTVARQVIAGVSAIIGVITLLTYLLWRGAFPALRARLSPPRDF